MFCLDISIIIHAFITRASSAMILNQRRWLSLGGQHGKGVDGLFEKVSFQNKHATRQLNIQSLVKLQDTWLSLTVCTSASCTKKKQYNTIVSLVALSTVSDTTASQSTKIADFTHPTVN